MTIFDVAMMVPGLPFDGNSLERHSLGGSETAGLYMGKALAKRGQRVKLFCNTQDITKDKEGVEYFPLGMWANHSRSIPHDISIIQRLPEGFSSRTAAKLNLLWMHDLALGRNAQTINTVMWNVDRVMVVSEFMRKQYMEVTGLPEDVFITTRNGVDLDLFARLTAENAKRDPYKLIYAARPERGLDVLLRGILPRLLAAEPKLQLHVFGYTNPVVELREFYDELKRVGASFGDRVLFREPMSKDQLYREYLQGSVYVYPTPSPVAKKFCEVSCISVMEAQAAGMVVVTSDRGALGETLGKGCGALIKGDPWSELYQTEFCNAVLRYVKDPNSGYTAAGRLHAMERASHLGWSAVAEDWIEMFEREIRSRSADQGRLMRHLWRQSDIVALRQLAPIPKIVRDGVFNLVHPIPYEQSLDYDRMMSPFEFAFGTRDDFREQYARIAKTHDARAFDGALHEPRLKLLLEWLEPRDDISTVVDYGCGLGNYAYFGALKTGKRFYGIDHDARTIEMAQEIVKGKGGTTPVSYAVADEDKPWPVDEPVDCMLIQEVLEHVPEPWALLENVEKHVKKDGWVYITVPFGPWEFSSYHTYPWRCHIWHFDQHDIHDMLGTKPELSTSGYSYGESPELGDVLGWWIITYRADHEPIGKIDLARKLWLSRPRETVSASLIVGGDTASQTLGWCLESLQFIADETIVVNCGMDDAAKAISQKWNAQVIDGPNPIESGFEVARNFGLAQCKMDWVLWIDSDEKIINPRHIQKYLRDNRFHGYGIRQHHFACDTVFTPDMPVRLFRRKERDGQTIRFFGAIHEHPELELNKGPGPVIVISDAHIAHVGYLIEGTRQRRFARNYQLLMLDKQRYPERLIQKHFIMRDNLIIVREGLRLNEGRIDEGMREKLHEVVQLFQKHFLGKGVYVNADSLQYYSEALQILGEGFDVSFSIEAEKDEAKPNGMWHYRFANKEDFMMELTARAAGKVDKFGVHYW